MELKSLMRPVMSRKFLALPVIAALIAVFSIGGATPASAAANTIYTTDGAGSARFVEHGDHVYLCDREADGHSVGVMLSYNDEYGRDTYEWRWNWSGGCKDINLRVQEDTYFYYKVCLGDHAAPGGKLPDVIRSSCSDTYYVYNNN
jgi:hypothetical protein